MIGTYCSWLPGDERGFRSKHHKIHSSGDYKHPPPPDEHAGLGTYHRGRHPKHVEIPYAYREQVAQTIAQTLRDLGFVVLIVSVSAKHGHLLAELPVDLSTFNQVIGKCKNKSSRMLKSVLPGRVWARGDKHILVTSRMQRKRTYLYLRDDQGPGAKCWCVKIFFRD